MCNALRNAKIILKTAVDAQRRVEMIERREIPTFELHLITIKNPCINLPSRPVPSRFQTRQMR
jgi:hypothetical protein